MFEKLCEAGAGGLVPITPCLRMFYYTVLNEGLTDFTKMDLIGPVGASVAIGFW
jgi:hypothetical protein